MGRGGRTDHRRRRRRAITAGCALTILHSVNRKHAAKRFSVSQKTGEIRNRSYGSETFFAVEVLELDTFADLAAALSRLTKQPHAFVIRGEPLLGINRKHCRRLLHRDRKSGDEPTFKAVPRRWFAVDIDHVDCPVTIDPISDPDGAIEYLIGQLPPELTDAYCWWQFTSSQSLPGHADTLSARLWYWLDEAVDDASLKRWAAAANQAGVKLVDPALYSGVQAHYTAAPLFDGLSDPLPIRSGIRQGLEESVSLVIPPADAKNPEALSSQGYEAGAGVEAYLAKIGGAEGSRGPIKSAIASYFAIYGSAASPVPIKAAIRRALHQIPADRQIPEKQTLYASDEHLDKIIDWVRQHHGDQPPKGFVGEPPPGFDAASPPPGAPQEVPGARPIIRTGGGRLPEAIDAAEEMLIANDRDVYAFGDQVVRPALRPIRIADDKTAIGLRLIPIGTDHMIERFTRVIDFRRFDHKAQDWVSIDCPRNIAAIYLARVGLWRLPQLTALTTSPLLLADGRILDTPGYDAASGILFDAQGVEFPPVPRSPTKVEALTALEFLMAPFREFPFVDEASKSVLRSLLLSTVSRFAFPFIPCHAFDAPSPGTGKSKLFDCASILQTGRECEVVSQAEDEVEFEKKLFAILLAGGTLISIDNCDRPLDSPFMCMALTQSFVQSRILGLSKTASVPNVAILGANGNNFNYAGDMLRRGLTGHLDAGTEKPWEREFANEDPVIVFRRERPRYAAAALTVLRGYLAAGRPKTKGLPLGGFEGWCRLVRDALLWLDTADPTLTIEAARKADPLQQKLVAVLTQWRTVLNDGSLTTRTVIEKASSASPDPTPTNQNHIAYRYPEFRNALLDVAGEHGRISVERLGSWLGNNKQKVVSIYDGQDRVHDCRLVADPPLHGYGRWRLERRQGDGSWR